MRASPNRCEGLSLSNTHVHGTQMFKDDIVWFALDNHDKWNESSEKMAGILVRQFVEQSTTTTVWAVQLHCSMALPCKSSF